MFDVKEKLVELLDDIQRNGNDFTDVEQCGMRYPDTVSNEDVAAHLIANGVTIQRWIPVTEQMPGEDDLSAFGEVLVMCKSDVCIALYLPSRSCFYRHGYRQDGVTHWMPLPEPPGEVADV